MHFKGLHQVGDQIAIVFNANRQTDEIIRATGSFAFRAASMLNQAFRGS
jgi:hypothetical protein